MSINGLALRKRIIRDSRRAIGDIGKTTATAGGTDRVRDALRFDMSTLSPEDESGAYIRISQSITGTATASAATTLTDSAAAFGSLTGALVVAYTAAGAVTVLTITSNSGTVLTGAAWSNGTPSSTSAYIVTYAHVAKVIRVDSTVGDIYFDPPVTTAVVSGTEYELWFHGIRPDEVDEARDQALTTRTSPWRLKPLSVLADVAEWTTVSNAAMVPQTLDFPREMFAQSALVTNSGAAGYLASPSWYVQPDQRARIFGRVAVRAQTASVRLRDITNSADITLSTPSTFTLRGEQWFEVTGTIPASCGEVQVWLGGASASCISDWSGVGLLMDHMAVFSMNSRVLSEHDVAGFYGYELPSPTGNVQRYPLQATREAGGGDGVMAIFDSPPACPVYYYERHRYAALQADYMSLVNRATGDGGSTDCNDDYIAWATMLELLEPRKRNAEMDRLLLVATKNTRVWDRRVGADPKILPKHTTQGGIALRSL